MRCDLHVPAKHSGQVDLPLLRHIGRECYFKEWARSARFDHRFSTADPLAWRARSSRAGASLTLEGEA